MTLQRLVPVNQETTTIDLSRFIGVCRVMLLALFKRLMIISVKIVIHGIKKTPKRQSRIF